MEEPRARLLPTALAPGQPASVGWIALGVGVVLEVTMGTKVGDEELGPWPNFPLGKGTYWKS